MKDCKKCDRKYVPRQEGKGGYCDYCLELCDNCPEELTPTEYKKHNGLCKYCYEKVAPEEYWISKLPKGAKLECIFCKKPITAKQYHYGRNCGDEDCQVIF